MTTLPLFRAPSRRCLPILCALLLGTGCTDSVPFDVGGPIPASVTPSFNAAYVGPGYDLGVTQFECITDLSLDEDNDGLNDDCENALAKAFDPALRVHTTEDVSREPAYAVRRTAGTTVGIAYLLSYNRDYGSDYSPAFPNPVPSSVVWLPHSGDSEFIILYVSETNGIWMLDSAFLSAHYGAGSVLWTSMDHSSGFAHTELTYADNARGRPNIWVSWGKHGNYPSFAACNNHPFDSCYHTGATWQSAIIYHGLTRNIGSYAAPFMDCEASLTPSYYTATECYWTQTSRFNGWYGGAWGKGATPYPNVLRQFGFSQDPPAPMPTVEVMGQYDVHPYANCNWLASTSGGTLPYTWEWFLNDQFVGTGPNYSANAGQSSFYLTAIVTDVYGFRQYSKVLIHVDPSHDYCVER